MNRTPETETKKDYRAPELRRVELSLGEIAASSVCQFEDGSPATLETCQQMAVNNCQDIL